MASKCTASLLSNLDKALASIAMMIIASRWHSACSDLWSKRLSLKKSAV